jgi:hypothetical protein
MALPLIALTHHAEEQTLTDAEFEREVLRQMDTEAVWYDKASRDKAMKAVKDAARSRYEKTKEGANAVAAKVKRTMAGAILPNTWRDKASYSFMAERLSSSYRRSLSAEHLKLIQADTYPAGFPIKADSSLMMYADMNFFADRVVINLMDSTHGSEWKVTGIVYIGKEDSLNRVTKEIDERLKALAKEFKTQTPAL